MQEKKLIVKIGLFLAAVLAVMVMISFDINEFLGVPLFLLWCFIMVMAATALGNILAVIFETLTGKEQKYPVQIIFSSILTLIGIAYALYAKNNYFMGEIEADLVFFAAIIHTT